jgi:signal transduction histidine kinase
VEVATHYVASEALTNAMKHANATVVHANLGITDTLQAVTASSRRSACKY